MILALPWGAAEAAVKGLGNLAGKAVVDCMNPIGRMPQGMGLTLCHGTSGDETVQGWLPAARVVKTLNQVGAEIMAENAAMPHRPVMFVAGGQAPTISSRDDTRLQALVRALYHAGKPTAALCHGAAALLDVRLSDGSFLLAGKTMTGFSAAEGAFVGEVTMWDWWVEPAMRARGATHVHGGMWANFALADGNLITGQQQDSCGSVARLVLDRIAA